jgi:hypothetical protein
VTLQARVIAATAIITCAASCTDGAPVQNGQRATAQQAMAICVQQLQRALDAAAHQVTIPAAVNHGDANESYYAWSGSSAITIAYRWGGSRRVAASCIVAHRNSMVKSLSIDSVSITPY